ncbi:MAG TPA: hypothetical protein PK156_26675 [Polyangium sp.]|nr:hypothetical protein [Polyangium sp.]
MSARKAVKVTVGTHEFEFVPPDVLRFKMRGAMLEEDAKAYLDFIHVHAEETGGLLYAAYELSQFTRIDEKARNRTTKVEKPYPFAGLVIVGASFSVRALAAMIIRAAKLIKPESVNFPHKFVATMAEAEAWIDELREKAAT